MTETYTTMSGSQVQLRVRYKGYQPFIPDDGMIDMEAVYRVVDGRAPLPRLTPREAVCVVAELTSAGYSVPEIAKTLGRAGVAGVRWVQHARQVHGILAVESYSPEWDWTLIADRARASQASEKRRRAAGLAS